MVVLGLEGYAFPNLVQSPDDSFIAGGLDVHRVTGNVLKLPEWVVTTNHRESVKAMVSLDGLLAEMSSSLPTVFLLMLLVWAFRYSVTRFIVTPTGEWLIPRPTKEIVRKGKVLSIETQFSKTLARFENSGWETVFYIMSSSMGLYVYSREHWSVWPTTNIWIDWPLQPLGFTFRLYYLLGLAFYSQAMISLLFVDKPRSDYFEYFLHHVVTIFLIAVSFYTRIQRYGLVILCLHDFGDIWLNCAKSFKYLGPKWDSMTTLFFAVFTVIFLATRLVFLPLTVIPSGYWEAMQVEPQIPGLIPMNIALCILQALHVFWFFLIIKAVKKQFSSGDLSDIREDEEDDANSVTNSGANKNKKDL